LPQTQQTRVTKSSVNNKFINVQHHILSEY